MRVNSEAVLNEINEKEWQFKVNSEPRIRTQRGTKLEEFMYLMKHPIADSSDSERTVHKRKKAEDGTTTCRVSVCLK
jgi:hypothetical protein